MQPIIVIAIWSTIADNTNSGTISSIDKIILQTKSHEVQDFS